MHRERANWRLWLEQRRKVAELTDATEARWRRGLADYVDRDDRGPTDATRAIVRAALSAAAEPRSSTVTKTDRGNARPILAVAASCIAAAGLALWLTHPSAGRDGEDWHTSFIAGGVAIDGKTIREGDVWLPASTLVVTDGHACVHPRAQAVLCLDGGSESRRDASSPTATGIELIRGRASLDWRRADDAPIRVGKVGIRSTQGAASVALEVRSDRTVSATVIEGVIEFTTATAAWTATAGEVVLLPGVATTVGRVEPPPSAVAVVPPSDVSTALSPMEVPTEDPSESTPPVTVTAGELLGRARALRHAGRWKDAAQVYRRLQRMYPTSNEARVAWVSLGDLQLDQLHDAQGAIESYSRYLARGGALEAEARYGLVLAYRTLGEEDRERVELERLLDRFPDRDRAWRLRQRLRDLR